jgi:hypothetical protein
VREDNPGRSSPPTDGIGKICASHDDCGPGLECHFYAHFECPDAMCSSCEIVCESNDDCPTGWTCNTPPLLPDSIPYICVNP